MVIPKGVVQVRSGAESGLARAAGDNQLAGFMSSPGHSNPSVILPATPVPAAQAGLRSPS
ncbi:MAG: hypothetical protein ACAH89_15620 [Rariglobus sp.]|nr:hypothetical protein [Rariglobus sp.]